MEQKHVIIIGAVAAGMSAAAKIKRTDPTVKVTVFEKGDTISYGACGLPYYVSDVTKDHKKLLIRTVEQFKEKQDIDIYIRHEVLKVFPEDKNILVKDLDEGRIFIVSYDQILIASGASPVLPKLSHPNMQNVFPLKTIEDANKIKHYFKVNYIGDVTILGAGYIGMELAESMLLLGKRVRVIEFQSQILPPFDADMAKIVQDYLESQGVEFQLEENIEGIYKRGTSTVIKTNQQEYLTDAVLACIGVRPNTKFVDHTNIQSIKNGAIVVDAYQRTSIPDIFAAGDCATAYHRILKQDVFIPLGTTANKQGRLAGQNMVGQRAAFPGILGTSVAKIGEYTVAKTGISEKEAVAHQIEYKAVTVKASSHASYYPDPKPIYIKLVYEPRKKVLLGAQMVGEEGVAKRIDVFATAIYNQMTTEEIGMLDLCYAPPFATVWDAVQVAANAAK